MNIPCNRCQKLLDSPDKRNAYYITELTIDKDKVLVRRNIIICKGCKKEKDEVIW